MPSKKGVALIVLLVAGMVLTMPGAAQAQLLVDAGGALGGSWSLTTNFTGPWDFDELVYVYNPVFDTGGGQFQSPGFDSFGGLGGAGWGVSSFNPNVVRLAGPSLDSIAPVGVSALSLTQYHDGDGMKRTGFNIGIYEGGAWVGGFQVEAGEVNALGGVDVFNVAGLSQADFNSQLSSVPEPGSVILMGLGLGVAGLGVLRRKRKS